MTFLAGIRPDTVPDAVLGRTARLFLDWAGSAIAGGPSRPVASLLTFSRTMGRRGGPAEVLAAREGNTPFFAALVNAAASHVVEQDDVHNASVTHPAAVVFPAVLATAQETGAAGRDFLAAAVAGYEATARVGVYLGPAHYRVFHTTGTAGTFGAATGVAHLLGADEKTLRMAFGSAGTQSAGLWQFLRDGADSKQLHTAKAAADGLLAARLSLDGFTGARDILEGDQGLAAGTTQGADPAFLTAGLGQRWAVLETALKVHASCRHTHPAADALLEGMKDHGIAAPKIERVTALVHQAAIDVLAPAAPARTPHQAKFSMPFVLALIAVRGHADVDDFTEDSIQDPGLRAFMDHVAMRLDDEAEAAYPEHWAGGVEVTLRDGAQFTFRVTDPRGDPLRPLSDEDLVAKFRRLARRGGATDGEADDIIAKCGALAGETPVGRLLTPSGRRPDSPERRFLPPSGDIP